MGGNVRDHSSACRQGGDSWLGRRRLRACTTERALVTA